MIIGITPEKFYRNEGEAINSLLSSGIARVHVRKPRADVSRVATMLSFIDSAALRGVTIHYHHDLVLDYQVGGLHQSANTPIRESSGKLSSCSCHDYVEVTANANRFDYLFLSPVFNSITKSGYSSRFNHAELSMFLAGLPPVKASIIALGGLCAKTADKARELGFNGIAILGALWSVKGDYINIDQTITNFQIIERLWNQYPR